MSTLGLLQIGNVDNLANMPSAGDIALSATDMASGIWANYTKDNLDSGGTPAPTPARVGTAAYYYSLAAVASNIITMRIGNIGSANGGKVARVMINKAEGLLQIARQGIAAYEDFCMREAGVYGANLATGNGGLTFGSYAAFSPATVNAQYGKDTAIGFAQTIAADDATATVLESATGLDDWYTYGGDGYAYTTVGFKLLNRIPTVSDMRIPAIGNYYQSMGQALLGIGRGITETYESVMKAQKLPWAVHHFNV